MVLGLLCAVFASVCYGGASVLQAVAARRTAPAEGLDPRLLVALFAQLPYLLGVCLDVLGFAASVGALQLRQPLFVVQAIVAGSVGVTAAIAAMMGAKLGRGELFALAALALGLILSAASAGAERDVVLATHWYVLMLVAVGPIALLGAAGLRLTDGRAATAVGLCAGLSFAVTAVAARTLRMPRPWWHLYSSPAAWAIVAGGLVGMLLFATALQRVKVTTVTALVLATETIVPSGVGLAFLGDTVRPGFAAVAATGLLLAVVGAGLLARFGEVDPELLGSGSSGGSGRMLDRASPRP